MKHLLFTLVFLLLSCSVYAIQKLDANPDEPAQVVASMSDANVISLSGGSIESVWGTEDAVTLEANVDTGQAIFRPVSNKPFTLFVQSEAGFTYTLSVIPRDKLIGQVILINEFDNEQRSELNRSSSIIPYKVEVKRLLKEIETSQGIKRLSGFRIATVNKAIPIWSETKIIHAFSWTRGNMVIDKYLITNVSENNLVMEEREFRNLAVSIRSIALRQHQLKPGETTILYTFRSPS